VTDALADDVLELRILQFVAASATHEFAIHLRGVDLPIGMISLRLDREDPTLVGHAGHIGYEITLAHRGQRHALRACRLLAPLALRHGFTSLWITTTPENAASCRTLDLLGARYVDTVDVPYGAQMRTLGLHRVRRYRWDLQG
jgi:predicted acetyltransferase